MKQRTNAAKLRLENLEHRNLMAGDVSVHVLDGTLFLNGDQASNGVELTSTAIEGQYIVAGIDAGGEATTVNGDSAPLVVDAIDRHVFVRMGDGDDILRAPELHVDGAMRVRMGRGDDAVHIGDVDAEDTVVEIARGLNVDLGTGDDRAGIANARIRWLRTSGGAGHDEIRVRDSQSRSVGVTGDSGDDEIRINDVTSRNIGIRGGAGNDVVRIIGSKAQRLSVHLGPDDDSLAVTGTKAERVRFIGSEGTDSLDTDLAIEDIYVLGFEEGL